MSATKTTETVAPNSPPAPKSFSCSKCNKAYQTEKARDQHELSCTYLTSIYTYMAPASVKEHAPFIECAIKQGFLALVASEALKRKIVLRHVTRLSNQQLLCLFERV